MEIRVLSSAADFAALEVVAAAIWRTDGASVVSQELLRVFSATGSYVSGAFAGGSMIGFAVGIVALHDGQVELHSHVAGVLPDAQDRGVGFALKVHQRAWAMARGITTISWTFDPLVRRNAVFNLAKLAASVTAYHVDFYGEMTDGVNAGQGSDRWWVQWQLGAPHVEAALAGVPRFVPDEVAASSAVLAVATPPDIVRLRHDDPAAAAGWRQSLREALTAALAAGYVVDGVTRDGRYVLSRRG